MQRPTSALIATTKKPRCARERTVLAMVVVLPMPPLPEVIKAMRGVEPESLGLWFHWKRGRWGFGFYRG